MNSDPVMLPQEWTMGRPGDWLEEKENVCYITRAQLLELAVQLSRPIKGHIIEFGVWKGASTRVIRNTLRRTARRDSTQREKRIYACDSFEGLPEAYERIPAGSFKTALPRLRGVHIVKGYFEESLTPQLAQEVGQVSLAHFDADLYSSTMCALNWITPLLHTGSLLLFDEFAGEDPAEYRAFVEWQNNTGVKTAFIGLFARGPTGEGEMTDRRAMFQVIGKNPLLRYRPSLAARAIRKLKSMW
jgi:hypothetical protein